MNTLRATLNLLACAALLAGCDAKAGSDYEGEPLLSFSGQVVVENAGAPADLVPVLAFRDDDYVLHIADVSVRGSFPANFQVDVLAPPPAEAFLAAGEPLPMGEPRVAVGFVAAASPEHPARMALALQGGTAMVCTGTSPIDLSVIQRTEEQIRMEGLTPPGVECQRETSLCAYGDEANCYVRVERCDPSFRICEPHEVKGDTELLKNTAEHFAGFSNQFVILYLDGPAVAGSLVASRLTEGKPIAAGYHIYEIAPRSDREIAENMDCLERSRQAVIASYNAQHGTQHTLFEELQKEPMHQQAVAEAWRSEQQARGCFANPYTLIPADERPLSLVIGLKEDPPMIGG